MKMFNNILILLLIIFLSNCEKKTDEITHGNIRGAVKLSINEIPTLTGATEIKSGETPWLWKMGWNGDNYDLVKYGYTWLLSNTNFVDVDMVITESAQQALRYLTEKQETSSIPLDLLQPEDQPTIAGEISFGQGRDFIRNNIVIEIRAEGIFNTKTEKLAQQIDKIIIRGPSFFSLSEIKPIINDFRITENPVIERTKTMIVLEVEDPNKKDIYFQWRFNTIVGLGGNIAQENGKFLYEANSTYTNVETNEEELTVIAINEFGFFLDSTILITTIKKKI
jgi:hypothetical protein